ncbi:riboflavin synthase [Corynebacterium sp. 320]|uniref:riboflavin synthase n=1 Tax=Corynebacterium TaxID=1716 RepID=UPI00125CCAED|nr:MULTISPECIES: riboflavin synthase [Corynebacterium]KAB1503685.1 riboflavin synthase [Corynebacterium sp. 320]KAB1553214.1 riboflavin synthase [Corynebacterium sp. 321]KAB1553567.1 riboflavin synthase [Corynebacterium sp. 319]KAB3527821.1 riboflavin synthase [Corynebacterium sp. 250]KAB3540690.1 riboflavin synthase [Corynebacterium sp. 366]
MFTGIVEEVGHIERIILKDNSAQIRISASRVVEDARRGDSIAVNGVCLTVTDINAHGFAADVMQVTLDYSTLGTLAQGDPVNLERAMSAAGRFGGHVVQGHVDGTATLMERTPGEDWEIFRFTLDNAALAPYIAHKGSIAINGTSLTVAELTDLDDGGVEFQVSLIPTTLEDTMLGHLRAGDKVNIECDVIAKYVERFSTVKNNSSQRN